MTTPLSELSAIVEAGTNPMGFLRETFPERWVFEAAATRLIRWLCSPGARDTAIREMMKRGMGHFGASEAADALLDAFAQHALEERT